LEPPNPDETQEFGHIRIFILALLAVVSAVTLSATAKRLESTAPELPVPRMEAPAQTEETSAPVVETTPTVLPGMSKKVEALATFLAKKYRVSSDVTQDLVRTAYVEGKRVGVDPLLIVAVMAVESGFNPIAESVSGAQGLMQIIPRYHGDKLEDAEGGEGAMLDPETNIQVGARVLKEYIRRGGSLAAGLQLYNGSPADTSNGYANKVLGEQQRLQQVVRRIRDDA
jgi:soluble lytic murein transglycosylase-like protein